tara:strand:- start:3853 stop:4167 length:315 start_codon:yes stop_codon:yes gene_type:complete
VYEVIAYAKAHTSLSYEEILDLDKHEMELVFKHTNIKNELDRREKLQLLRLDFQNRIAVFTGKNLPLNKIMQFDWEKEKEPEFDLEKYKNRPKERPKFSKVTPL